MDEDRIREIVREELNRSRARYVFDALVQLLDGKNIRVGRGTGTTIGTATDQKVGFHGKTSIQATKINDPTGGTTVDSEARTAINAIIDALEGKGITAV